MKTIHKIILTICIFALCLNTMHAIGQPLQTLQKTELSLATTAMQTTDNIAIQKELIITLMEKQQAFETRYYTLVGITLFLVLLFGVLCFLNKRGDKRLDKIMTLLEKRKLPTDEKPNTDQYQLDIDEATVTAILKNLQAFEKEKGFLISKITLHQFAKQLQTNTKYLSKVINTYKLKSFRNYINDLRIQYSIQELENNASYRKYTIKAMAKEVGFSTSDSFSKAFQKKTGKTVSSFLNHTNQHFDSAQCK